jgi:hypothetical protein
MWLRILLAGIVGGILIFIMGATNHMAFHLLDRTFKNLPEPDTFSEQLKTRDLNHGFFLFPGMPTAEEQKDEATMAAWNDRYAAGPSGMLLIVHRGPLLMGELMGKELASNFIAALLAAWIISLAGSDVGFFRRWLAAVVIGLIGWFSFIASYGIWYRFPHDFVHDEALCALLEWSVAGIAIAAIVHRPPLTATQPAPASV